MESSDDPEKITLERLQDLVSRYGQIIPESLQGLDETRLKEIPETLAKRRKDGDAFLEEAEVVALVDWKLKHGKYRPNLAKLVSSNSPETTRSTTKTAFATYNSRATTTSITPPTKALTTLTELKGIGPATASLLLSCLDPENVPFFSDELYRYTHFESTGPKQGWDRKIGYTMKEYNELFARVHALKHRLMNESGNSVSALDVEKAAYVLYSQRESARLPAGKRGAEADGGAGMEVPRAAKRRRKGGR
ncbi:MAG: hypothetical protein Q9163_004603 [Psora crenata]